MCTLLPWPCGSAGKQPCDRVGVSENVGSTQTYLRFMQGLYGV